MPRKKRDPSVIWEEGDQPDPVTKANPLVGIEVKVLQVWLDNSPSVKQAYETPRLRLAVERSVRAAVFAAFEEEINLRAQGVPAARSGGDERPADVDPADLADTPEARDAHARAARPAASASITCRPEAAKTGEILRIIYRGGSQPGTVREISPITTTDVEVRARDLSSGLVKTFRLSKIDLVDAEAIAPAYDPAPPPPFDDTCSTISEAFQRRVPALEALGWHVELSKDAIALYSFFKNGKLRKVPTVRLSYDELVYDFHDFDGSEVMRKSSRPYNVGSPVFGRSFGKLSKAADVFLNEAQRLAPIQ